jgi:hypothetical protein
MSKRTKARNPKNLLKADRSKTEPYFRELLTKIGERFLAGEASLDIVRWICVDQKLPMNAIEALNAILMGVDLVRKANYIDTAIAELSEGELGVRFTLSGIIPGMNPNGATPENVTTFPRG